MRVLLPAARLERWVANFEARHGPTKLSVSAGLVGVAEDGSTFRLARSFDRAYEAAPDISAFVASLEPLADWGVLLVRKGGFAMARLEAGQIVAHKVGNRHVQGRTKAGGQSQQRFARRRDNQARAAYLAAADYAFQILGSTPWIVTGGDRQAVKQVRAQSKLPAQVDSRWLESGNPKRYTLDRAIHDAMCAEVVVSNTDERSPSDTKLGAAG